MMDPLGKLRYERHLSSRSNIRRQSFRLQYFVVSGLDDSGIQKYIIYIVSIYSKPKK